MMTVYDIEKKKHVQMTHEESARDCVKNWNGCDIGYPLDIFERDKAEILAAMKTCGYRPVEMDANGKHVPFRGRYEFTRKMAA